VPRRVLQLVLRAVRSDQREAGGEARRWLCQAVIAAAAEKRLAASILNNMKSPEELAALLAHEYSHVELKHATRNLFRTLSGYLFLSIIFGDMSGVGGVLIENAHELRNLSYNRDLETEADNHGLKILEQNNISNQGMIDLFELLKKESNGLQVNELISTHPDLDSRIKNVQEYVSKHHYKIKSNDSLNVYFNQLNSNWNE
jgi:predicted Zn-dependent protease